VRESRIFKFSGGERTVAATPMRREFVTN